MSRFNEQFYKEAQKAKMTPEERGVLRERVMAFMELHVVPVEEVVVESVSWMSYVQYWKYAGVFVVMLMLVPPFLAENAMPGDLLYPLKTQINEEVRGYLAFGTYEKIEWETARIERRLAEARLLADNGQLSAEEEANVVAAVEEYTESAQASIDALREDDADAASLAQIAFASALEVQADALQNERVAAAERGEEPGQLQLSAALAARSSAATEAATASTPAVDVLFARLEAESTVARELFSSIEESATKEEAEKMDDRIESIKRKIDKAHQLENGETEEVVTMIDGAERTVDDAQVVLRAALSDLRKLISFMTNIDLRSRVSVDVIVPAEGKSVDTTEDEVEVNVPATTTTTISDTIQTDTDSVLE